MTEQLLSSNALWEFPKYRKHRRKTTASSIITRKLPLTGVPWLPVVALLVALTGMILIFYFGFKDVDLYANVATWQWTLYGTLALGFFIFSKSVATIASRILSWLLHDSFIQVYVVEFKYHMTVLLWGIYIRVTNQYFLIDWAGADYNNSDRKDWVAFVGNTAIIVACLNWIWRTCLRYFLLRYTEKSFWKRVKESRRQEDIISYLHRISRKAIRKREEESKASKKEKGGMEEVKGKQLENSYSELSIFSSEDESGSVGDKEKKFVDDGHHYDKIEVSSEAGKRTVETPPAKKKRRKGKLCKALPSVSPAPRDIRVPLELKEANRISDILNVQSWRGLWMDQKQMIVSEEEAAEWAEKIFDTLSEGLKEQPKKIYPFGMYVDLVHKKVVPKELIFSLFSRDEDPEYVFKLLDVDGNGLICKSDMKNAVKKVYMTRRNLSYTLIDHKNILGAATRFLGAIFWVLTVILILLLAGVDLFTQLIPLSGALLALSFMFGPALKNLMDGFILALVVRPFSVGDRINVDGETMIVDNIELYITTAHNTDGRVILLYNPTLLSKKIYNYARSFCYTLNTSIQIDVTTPIEKIAALQATLQEYLSEHSDVWNVKDWNLWYVAIENSKLVRINIWVPMATLTWAQPGKYNKVVTLLLLTIQAKCEELGIGYKPPPQEIIVIDRA
eukprot:CAMPEP_0174259528 /NCGR_PEP_ID=MMETSP0439-20130205/8337_1 /TAXON_ID=0 /ORGANISM="Stereomyxa ramosa, Strain Chinc5" /LENGTH=674 /DNA_ID=CAMNT_0015343441 /DNA_START=85 /DNA_END=2109 /DNA_ORIENTATION=+